MEFTSKLLENFPEKCEGKQGFIDGSFEALESTHIKIYLGDDALTTQVGFEIWDKNEDLFQYCVAGKSQYGETLFALENRQRIRVSGVAMTEEGHMWIMVNTIEVAK